MRVTIVITLKPDLLDPQGNAIHQSLGALGFSGIAQVRQGKLLQITVDETDPARARQTAEAMCATLLVNPVIEDYTVSTSP